jgi:hypothetical protein
VMTAWNRFISRQNGASDRLLLLVSPSSETVSHLRSFCDWYYPWCVLLGRLFVLLCGLAAVKPALSGT